MNRLISIIILFSTVGCVSLEEANTESPKNTDSMQVYDEILVGMSLEQVVEKLLTRGIEFHQYMEEPRIRGIFRNVGETRSFVSSSFRFYLCFGDQDRLIGKELEEVLTGI